MQLTGNAAIVAGTSASRICATADSERFFVRELVRADQKRHAHEQLEQVLLSAINSGDPIEVTPEMIDEVRHRLKARAAQRKRVGR